MRSKCHQNCHQCFRGIEARGTAGAVSCCRLFQLDQFARVAKLADARDLKSRVPKGTYRFDSGPGHQVEFLGDPSATLGISARGSDAAQTPQLDMGVEVRLG